MLRKLLARLKVGAHASRNPLTVSPSAPLSKAVKMMSRFNVGGLLVAERGDSIDVCGVVTERDLLMQVDGSSANEPTVGDVMTQEVPFVPGRWDLDRSLQTMLSDDVHYLPVLGMGGKVDAVLSIFDICRAILDQKDTLGEHSSLVTLAHVIDHGCRHEATESKTVSCVHAAVECMRESPAGSILVPITDSGTAHPTYGIFTARDFVRALAHGEGVWAAPVSAHVTLPSIWAVASDPVMDALALLSERNQSALPVVNGSPRVLSMQEILAFMVERTEEDVIASLGHMPDV